MQKIFYLIVPVLLLSACSPQSTPSMMNTSVTEVSHEMTVEQIPLGDVTSTNMSALAEEYRKNSTGAPLDLTVTYDPKSKVFTAMRAVHKVKEVQTILRHKGVKNSTAQTMAVPNGKPTLMVSYDVVRAQAPSDCTPMPGLNHNETGRFIGDYKFGCGVETMFAKQIARPSDLEGKSTMDTRTARRESAVVEGYSAGEPRVPLEGIERDDLAAGN